MITSQKKLEAHHSFGGRWVDLSNHRTFVFPMYYGDLEKKTSNSIYLFIHPSNKNEHF